MSKTIHSDHSTLIFLSLVHVLLPPLDQRYPAHPPPPLTSNPLQPWTWSSHLLRALHLLDVLLPPLDQRYTALPPPPLISNSLQLLTWSTTALVSEMMQTLSLWWWVVVVVVGVQSHFFV